MISHIEGKLIVKDIDRVEVMTAGGVAYELLIPLGVFETLPKQGETVSLHTWLVVKEDSWQLFGFSSMYERRLFQKLLTADRKSTRLNSSHLVISYAVFCLKKKNKD